MSREQEQPVVEVNWKEAQAFCQWLTDKEIAEGRLLKGAKYRLPKDEEWSRAVGLAKEDGATPKERSGRDRVHFPWGQDLPPKTKVGNYADATSAAQFPEHGMIGDYNDGFASTAPVGSFPPSVDGIYDLGGNVWEQCEELLEPGSSECVQRGGSWLDCRPDDLLSSNRNHLTLDFRSHNVGFRCVLEPAPSATK